MIWLTASLLGYLIGSIPFGLLLSLAAGKGDIRRIGSGNIGATNVLRTGSKWLAAATLLLDLGKGFAAVTIAWLYWPAAVGFAALGAVLGHCFPLWLGFRGGKGVATMAGLCFGLNGLVGIAFAAIWMAVLALMRVSSLGGMAAAVSAPITALLIGHSEFAPWLTAIAAVVLWQHRENIRRLRAGTEPKVGSKK